MIENSHLLELVGKTKTQKLIDDVTKQYQELKLKTLGETNNPINSMAIVTNLTNKDEIKHIGMSCVNDLFMNNFGTFFGAFISGDTGQKSMIDSDGVDRNYIVWGNVNFTRTSEGSVGFRLRVGAGTLPAQRTDFAVQVPFTNSPESGFANVQNGAYNSGLAKISTSSVISPTGGGGSVAEVTFYGVWSFVAFPPSPRNIQLSRENISPVVPFSLGDSINVDYSWILS